MSTTATSDYGTEILVRTIKPDEDGMSVEERSELDEYERVTALVELMQSKARLSLKQAGLSP